MVKPLNIDFTFLIDNPVLKILIVLVILLMAPILLNKIKIRNFIDWDDFLIISRNIKEDDNLVVVLGRDESRSFTWQMRKIPGYLNNYFSNTSFILIYPLLVKDDYMTDEYDYRNPSVMQSIKKI